jgi:hypothetical protein
MWTIFEFKQKYKFWTKKKNQKNKKKKKKEKKRTKKKRRKREKRRKTEKEKNRWPTWAGPNALGCVGGARRGAKRAANGRQIGIPIWRMLPLLGASPWRSRVRMYSFRSRTNTVGPSFAAGPLEVSLVCALPRYAAAATRVWIQIQNRTAI